jgi:subtilisin family serine protease
VSDIDRVRVAVIDSGVFADHPHVGGVAGGIAFDDEGTRRDDYVDRLGHGTAVTAAIKEKAPDAELYAVKVFDRVLGTRIGNLIAAIDWAAENGMHVANLSLGSARVEHERVLREAVDRAAARGLVIVAARDDGGVRWLPGSLPRVVQVQLDSSCPRHEYRVATEDGAIVFRASGYPREIPGVAPERNLNGISFAVANMTGFVARAMHDCRDRSLEGVLRALTGAYLTHLTHPTYIPSPNLVR